MSDAPAPSIEGARDATTTARAPDGPRVLVFTTLFPTPEQPQRGLFVRHRVAAVARTCPTRVVVPVLQRRLWGQSPPPRIRQGALDVSCPPYATIPKLGRFADGLLLYAQVLPLVRRIRAEFPFDVIDAQYAFPDGTAAAHLAAHFRVPFAVTVRGSDLNLLPRFRSRRRAIARTLQRADRIFAVSQELAARAEGLGATRGAIRVVSNGVDAATFFHADRSADRRDLGIPADRRLVVCVGHLLSRKGQHILIEALAGLGAGAEAPHLVLIGSDPSATGVYRRRLERLIARQSSGERIHLLGSIDQDALARWYRAADVLVLPSLREGSPNVVREALTCGTPVIASRVGGIPELVASEELGLLVEAGDVEALTRALREALQRDWDRSRIAALADGRDWRTVGAEIAGELAALVADRSQR